MSAPSGGGKTTLCRQLLKATPGLVRSVSMTTRRMRRGEVEGKDYLFTSPNTFRRLRREGKLLEWTRYNRSFYGTPLLPLKRALAQGKDVILLLDVRGARVVKRRFKDATTIFLLPPTLEDLKKRLIRRKTEKRSDIVRRLRLAKKEMAQTTWYDHVVVNDRLKQALRALQKIIRRKKRDRRNADLG